MGWAKSERWSGSRAFGEKCSHSIAVRGHPGKSRLADTKKKKRFTNDQNSHLKKVRRGLKVTAFIFNPCKTFGESDALWQALMSVEGISILLIDRAVHKGHWGESESAPAGWGQKKKKKKVPYSISICLKDHG